MIDRLFFVVLVLNATGLFRFFAPQLGVSIGQVSLTLLVFNLVYLVWRRAYFIPIFAKLLPWCFLLLFWPLATLVYAPTLGLREIGLAVYGFSLFAGTIVYTVANGLRAIHYVFLTGLILTILGQVLNMAMPQYFVLVAELANARVLSMGRPGGFFLQPNSLALGLGLLFIGWLALAKRDTIFREPIIILIFLGCELLTGSRTGMVLGVFIVVLHLGYQWRGKKALSWKMHHFSTRLAILLACIFFGMAGAKFFIHVYGDQIGRQPGSLIDRMSIMLEFNLSSDDELTQDVSLQDRFGAQRHYLHLIEEKPLLGHGFGAESFYLEHGAMELSSHSTMLSVAMEYGVLYPLVFSLALMSIFVNRHRRSVELVFRTNTVMQFTFIALLMFSAGGGLFERRLFFVVLGMVCAALYCPRRLLAYNLSSGDYTRVLTMDEIRQGQIIRRRGAKAE